MRAVLGVSSIVAGVLGLIAVIGARHGESFRGTASAYVLSLADRLGLIRSPPPDSMPEARAPGLLSFTDETALQAILSFGIVLGVISMLLAVWASVRREDSLYLGAGLVCGWLSLVAVNFFASVGSLLVSAVFIFALRRKQHEEQSRQTPL